MRHRGSPVHMGACVIYLKPIRRALFSAVFIYKKKTAFWPNPSSVRPLDSTVTLPQNGKDKNKNKNKTRHLFCKWHLPGFSRFPHYAEYWWLVTAFRPQWVFPNKSWKFLNHDFAWFCWVFEYGMYLQDDSWLFSMNGFQSQFFNAGLLSVNKRLLYWTFRWYKLLFCILWKIVWCPLSLPSEFIIFLSTEEAQHPYRLWFASIQRSNSLSKLLGQNCSAVWIFICCLFNIYMYIVSYPEMIPMKFTHHF